MGAVTLEVKGLTRKYVIELRGVVHGEGGQVSVLPRVTVSHLKSILHSLQGMPPLEQRIVFKGSKQLLHETASLGAYLWEVLIYGQAIHLDLSLRMSTGACLKGVPDSPPAIPIEWRCVNPLHVANKWQSLACGTVTLSSMHT